MIGFVLIAVSLGADAQTLARDAIDTGRGDKLLAETDPEVLERAAGLIEAALWPRFLDTGDDGYELRLLARAAREKAGKLDRCPDEPYQRVRQSEIESRLVDGVNLVYPPLAKQARIQGSVVIDAGYDRDGRVCGLRVRSGHPILIEAAVNAVRATRIQPFAQQARVTLMIPFTLEP